MILDQLSNAGIYQGLSDAIGSAIDLLKNNDYSDTAPGVYPLEGTENRLIVEEFMTRPPEDTKWETHESFIDVQYVISGAEQVGYAPRNSLIESEPYNPENDKTRYTGEGGYFEFKAGMMAIYFPDDGHRCCGLIGESRPCKKICVKVKI